MNDDQPRPSESTETEKGFDGSIVSWAKVHEKWKTARLIVICAAVLIGLWMILDAIQAIMTVDPWVAIFAVLVSLLAPTVVFWRIRGKFKGYIQKDHQRVIVLEGKLDAKRESSGLAQDGNQPEGEP